MRYNDVRPSIKSGDVLVWHYTDWYMRLVSLFTTSKYNHIGVAIVISGRVMVLEAVGRGVQLNPLSEHLPCYLITMPDYWNADLETFAFSTVGHKYSVWQAILGGLGLLDAGKDNRWQCAELTNTDTVEASLTTIGSNVTNIKTTTDNLTPYFENIISAIDNIHGGVGINTSATAFTLVQGTVVSGTFESTHTFNDAEHYVRDNGGLFDVNYLFDVDIDSVPTSFTYIGYVADKHEVMSVAAWNYTDSTWEEIGQVTGENTNTSFTFPLMRSHVGFLPGQIGDVKIRFYSDVVSDIFVHTDQMYVSYTKTEARMGYTSHIVSATATSIELPVDASSIDNYYVPSLLMVNHGTGYNQYAKVIGYVGATRTMTLELPMTVVLDTTSHITLLPWGSTKIETAQYTNIDSKLTTVTDATDTLEASATQIAGYVDTLETVVGDIQNTVNDIETAVSQISGLSPTQQTMLLEMYELLGLNPLKPLTVTNTSRSVTGINQTITSDANQTVVTRV